MKRITTIFTAAFIVMLLSTFSYAICVPGSTTCDDTDRYGIGKKYNYTSNGKGFEVWVYPPQNKTITPEIDAWMSSGETSSTNLRRADMPQEPVNLTGFKFVINRLSPTSSNECFSDIKFYRPIPIEINAGGKIEIKANFATSISVEAFPTSGNVDVGIWDPDDYSWCDKSIRPKNRLDSAGCYSTSCTNEGWFRLNAVIWNPSETEKSTFVTVTHVLYNK